MRAEGLRVPSLRVAAAVVALALASAVLPAQATSHGTGHSMAWGRETYLLLDAFDLVVDRAPEPGRLHLKGWHGGAVHRLWFSVANTSENFRPRPFAFSVAYGRLVAPFWDLQVGAWLNSPLRFVLPNQDQFGASVGVHGLAPGWFEFESALRLSAGGDLSARLSGAYDLYLTQRLVLDPHVELDWRPAASRERGMAAGVSSIGYGGRVRYEASRRFAPYVALRWEFARGDNGVDPVTAGTERTLHVGVRAWR